MLTINNVGEIVQVDKSGLIVATDAAGNIKGFVLTDSDGYWWFIDSSTCDRWGDPYDSLEILIDNCSDYKFKFINND